MSDAPERESIEEPHENIHPAPEVPFDLPPAPRPRKKGWAWPAWIVIFGMVGLIVVGQTRPDKHVGDQATADDKLDTAVFEMQARYLIGAGEFLHGQSVDFYDQAETMDRGALGQRLRFIVVAGELAGPHEARAKIAALRKQLAKHKVKPSDEQTKVLAALDTLYRDYEGLRLTAPGLSAHDRAFLKKNLGWFGELALTPHGVGWYYPKFVAAGGCLAPATLERLLLSVPPPAQMADQRDQVLAPATRTFLTILSAVGGMMLVGVLGFAGIILFLVLLTLGKVHSSIQCGSLHGNIYAETFALWLLLFAGLSVASHFIPEESADSLTLGGGVMLLSLLAVTWPILRGIPWRQVRDDIGWTWGRKPLLEPVIGVGCYAMALPLLAVGLGMTLILMAIQQALNPPAAGNPFSPSGFPAHPIIKTLAEGGLLAKLQVVFLASIVAPLVEETMFRGVLYRHLREASHRWGIVLSVLFSGTLVSFIFAVIHPQGWVAVPVLMSLAYGFTIAREWRGTLIPAMVGHGLSNGLVTMIVILALG